MMKKLMSLSSSERKNKPVQRNNTPRVSSPKLMEDHRLIASPSSNAGRHFSRHQHDGGGSMKVGDENKLKYRKYVHEHVGLV